MKRCLPFAIFIFALCIRLYGINFGLPETHNWDEPTVVQRAIRFGSGDLNPHFFAYPTLYMYVLTVVLGAVFVVGKLLGVYHSSQDFAIAYFVDPSVVYLAARTATALVGAATVALTYVAGRRFFGQAVGLLGALFLSVSVLHATHSHVALTDVPHTFFVVAALLPLHKVLTRGERRDYVLTGLLIGLGIATKYLAGLQIAGLLLAHVLRHRAARTNPWKDLSGPILGVAATGAGFFVGSPYCLLDYRQFLADMKVQAALSQEGDGWSWGYFLVRVLPCDLGLPLTVLAGVGLVLALRARRPAYQLFLLFPIVYFLFVMRYPKAFARYMIPEDPFLGVLAGYALTELAGWTRRLPETLQKGALALIAGLTALAVAIPLAANLRWSRLIGHETDPRTQARLWVERTIPADSRVALQPLFDRTFLNAPLLTDRKLRYIDQNLPGGPKFAAVKRRIFARLKAEAPLYQEVDFSYDCDALARSGAQYVFLSSLNGPVKPDFLQQLEQRCPPPQVFAPTPGSTDHLPMNHLILPVTPPTIRIYRLPPSR